LTHILLRILASIVEETRKQPMLSKVFFKQLYMERHEAYETEEEVMMNRIYLRKYLRELMLNTKKVIELLR